MNKLIKLAAVIAAHLLLSGCSELIEVGVWSKGIIFDLPYTYPQYGLWDGLLFGLAMIPFIILLSEILIRRKTKSETEIWGKTLTALLISGPTVWFLNTLRVPITWLAASALPLLGAWLYLRGIRPKTLLPGRKKAEITPLVSPLVSPTTVQPTPTPAVPPGYVSCPVQDCGRPNPPDYVTCQWCEKPRSAPKPEPSQPKREQYVGWKL